ncbi:hypothetical protein [Sphingobacterium sp. HMA12]|uniref:hypothetical protein n=1 Tax=Sphingobacterium sp. HMA12 TaxID=2050894 RepID=UPI000CEA0A40|nr:hypothetical protein [Sphingobacterium sp. HMA12]
MRGSIPILAAFTAIVMISCRGNSKSSARQAPDTPTCTERNKLRDNNISCDQLIVDLVRSSNAMAIKTFGNTRVQSRLVELTDSKATIKMYVINDISETPSEKRMIERAVGWLELHRHTSHLLDISNDPDNPVVIQYDKSLLKKHNLFELCNAAVPVAKPGSAYVKRDVMLEDDIRFNGKLKRYFTIGEFGKVFGKPDSTQLLNDQAPCITIFDTEAPDDKYLYKSGSRFETSRDSIAVDEFWFLDGNFITYKGVRIDAYTTMRDMEQLFPIAVSERLGMDKEGKIWVIKLREDYEDISDGHIKVFFKNGKVSFMHWWFPC